MLLCDLTSDSRFAPDDQPGLRFRFAQGRANDGGAQDMCQPTNTLSSADAGTFNNPHFSVEMDSMSMLTQGVQVEVQNVVMTGTYSADGRSISAGTLEGFVDTRSMASLVSDEDDPGAICDLLMNTVGVSCVDCPDGQQYCMALEVQNLESRLTQQSLEDRDCVDILEDPACEGEWDDWDSDSNGTYDLCD